VDSRVFYKLFSYFKQDIKNYVIFFCLQLLFEFLAKVTFWTM